MYLIRAYANPITKDVYMMDESEVSSNGRQKRIEQRMTSHDFLFVVCWASGNVV
jgi:hypothetical protein